MLWLPKGEGLPDPVGSDVPSMGRGRWMSSVAATLGAASQSVLARKRGGARGVPGGPRANASGPAPASGGAAPSGEESYMPGPPAVCAPGGGVWVDLLAQAPKKLHDCPGGGGGHPLP